MIAKSIAMASALAALHVLFSGTASAAEDDVSAALKRTLQSRFPDVPVDRVAPSTVPGLYEVVSGDRITYADATGDHLLMGPLLDTRSRRNLTEDRIAVLQAIDFSVLPLDRAIKLVKGDGRRTLAVFADPDCPFCEDLEKSLEAMTDVTVYTFLFPLESIHPGATARARQIWCAEDRALAWADWMLRNQLASKNECEGDPIVELQALAQSLKVNSTPTLFLGNGRRVNGAVPREQLEKLLDEAATAPSR